MQLNISIEPDTGSSTHQKFKVLVCTRHLGNLVRKSDEAEFTYEEISYLSNNKYAAGDSLTAAKKFIENFYAVAGSSRAKSKSKVNAEVVVN